MAGGYVMTTLMAAAGVPFPSALLIAVAAVARGERRARAAALSPLLRRQRARPGAADHRPDLHVGGAAHLYLGTAGAADAAAGVLRGQLNLIGRDFPTYRSFLIVCGAVVVTLLWLALERTRFGAKVRAAVDNRAMAQSVGINTSRLFMAAFALGSGLAALGGALGADIAGDQPGLCARAPGLLPDRRRGRRARQHSRAVRRRAAARHRRHRVQIFACPSSARSSSMR